MAPIGGRLSIEGEAWVKRHDCANSLRPFSIRRSSMSLVVMNASASSLRADGSARSAALRQAPRSNPGSKGSLDCFVAALLAMTVVHYAVLLVTPLFF